MRVFYNKSSHIILMLFIIHLLLPQLYLLLSYFNCHEFKSMRSLICPTTNNKFYKYQKLAPINTQTSPSAPVRTPVVLCWQLLLLHIVLTSFDEIRYNNTLYTAAGHHNTLIQKYYTALTFRIKQISERKGNI